MERVFPSGNLWRPPRYRPLSIQQEDHLPFRDIVTIAGWLAVCVGALLALGVGFGLMVAGALTIGLGLWTLEAR